jgi:hypothetical protein
MTTEELHERLQGIQGYWDQALAGLEEVSGGLEAIIKTPGEMTLWQWPSTMAEIQRYLWLACLTR